MRRYGLIGHPVAHSFSAKYFTEKFIREDLSDCLYELYDLQNISLLREIFRQKPDLCGLNITIPYKSSIIPFLDDVSEEARLIGAVNTVRITGGKWYGYNTDSTAFMQTLKSVIPVDSIRALVLGTGGASKAVCYGLQKLNIPFVRVSRFVGEGNLSYAQIDEKLFRQFRLIINTTPLGMSPDTHTFPLLPYASAVYGQIFYDLVYNPAETVFLRKAREMGCQAINGLDMLYLQAENSWKIWNL